MRIATLDVAARRPVSHRSRSDRRDPAEVRWRWSMTPNDPTGNAIGVTTAAQLGRQCRLLVLDERSAEMQRRSMIPLVEEFDSIVLLRSFADWAGLGATAPGYAISTSRIAGAIDRSDELGTSGLQAALAAVSNASKLDAIAHRVRIERLRLYRMLRKLNFLTPYAERRRIRTGGGDTGRPGYDRAGACRAGYLGLLAAARAVTGNPAVFGDFAGRDTGVAGCVGRYQSKGDRLTSRDQSPGS